MSLTVRGRANCKGLSTLTMLFHLQLSIIGGGSAMDGGFVFVALWAGAVGKQRADELEWGIRVSE